MRTTLGVLLANACVFMSTCSVPPSLLELIERDGTLRVLTRNGPTTYYEGRQGPRGFEYELASGLADHLGLELQIIVENRIEDLMRRLADQEADLIAAGLTVTPERAESLRFAPPILSVDQIVVYRIGGSRPVGPADLADLRGVVPANSSYVSTLRELAEDYPGLEWEEAADADVAEILFRLSQREFDYTVVDSHEFRVSRQYFPELRSAFELAASDEIAWATRPGDESLVQAAADYLADPDTQEHMARLDKLYFGNESRLNYVGTRRFLRHIESRLPPLEPHFVEAAEATGLDWQLLAAVAYQESHWRPRAVSPTGVRGIMMLTRTTAASVGVEDRTDPVQSIHGGARYLLRVKAKIPERIVEPDRTFMALAAYNVGFLHLEDARVLTQRQGKDPDRWVHVREHLPLLAQKKWYSQVKRGYARGWEPVRYVDNIRSYYDILVWATSNQYRNPFEDPVSPLITQDGIGAISTP